ncbi:MAG TPA: hypothetical protein VHA57_10090 [Actinomycetota bacterium]|nr:hypothetical protein [Actinomycetota bacterium]
MIWLSAEGGTGQPACQEAPRPAAVTGATLAVKLVETWAGVCSPAAGVAGLGAGDGLGLGGAGGLELGLASCATVGGGGGGPGLRLAEVLEQAAQTVTRARNESLERRTAPR